MLSLLPLDPSPWLATFGRCHPVLLHAPLGLLPAMAVLEFGSALLRRPQPRGAVLALAWVTLASAATATASGLVLAGEPGYTGDLVGNHKIAGIVLTVLCALVAIAACFTARLPVRLCLLLALGAMVPAGHLGGNLSHGSDFLTEHLAAPPPATTEFERTILPILKRSCTKCHNPQKQKGELDLTTRAGLERGGESGEVLVPGKPDESDLLRLCLLPETDEDAMPPEGKRPRPSEVELTTLKAWIGSGAKFD